MTKAYRSVNVVIVFHPDGEKVLMCHRTKNPYLGLYNFVGGKKEANESDDEAAYRELFEETGISSQDIKLTHLFTTDYHLDEISLFVYFGSLKSEVELRSEKHPLHWIPIKGTDFADESKFAGQGNIKHMIEIIQESKQREGL